MDKDNTHQNKISKFEGTIKELEKKNAELEENWKRALADYINLEKRTHTEKQSTVAYSNEILIRHLLPVLDHLQMLRKHTNDHGVGLIIQEFEQVLLNAGVQKIDALGKYFDHNCMEAIETVEGEKNKVVEIITEGYLLNEKLLRPARVKVGLGESSKEE